MVSGEGQRCGDGTGTLQSWREGDSVARGAGPFLPVPSSQGAVGGQAEWGHLRAAAGNSTGGRGGQPEGPEQVSRTEPSRRSECAANSQAHVWGTASVFSQEAAGDSEETC